MTEPQTFQIKPFTVLSMRWQPENPEAAKAVLDWLESVSAGPKLSDDGQSIILLATGSLVEPGARVFQMPGGGIFVVADDWFHRQYAPTAHPEDFCHRCGRPLHDWSAPSPLWNEVMRGGSINGEEIHNGIVCPTCFSQLAEQRGIASRWRFHAKRVHVPLETVTPSGRVWDEETWMWVDPEALPDVG